MLSNAYFLAKFRLGTAGNEPAKNLQNFANFRIIFPILDLSCRASSLRRPTSEQGDRVAPAAVLLRHGPGGEAQEAVLLRHREAPGPSEP